MKTQRLLVRIDLPGKNGELNEEEIEKLVLEYQKDFEPLFERSIDIDDGRVQLVDDSMEVGQVELSDDGKSGCVTVEFMSSFYAGCKDLDSTDWHQEELPFSIEDGTLIFNIPLPLQWHLDN